jgi:hypothetical protein
MPVKSINVETVKSFLSAFALEKFVADIIFPYLVKVVFKLLYLVQLIQRNYLINISKNPKKKLGLLYWSLRWSFLSYISCNRVPLL